MPILLAAIARDTVSPDFYNPRDAESFVRHSFWGLQMVFQAASLKAVTFYSHGKKNLFDDPSLFEIAFTGTMPTSEVAKLRADSRIVRALTWEIHALPSMPRDATHPVTRIENYDTHGQVKIKARTVETPVCKEEATPISVTANDLVGQFFNTARGFLPKAGQKKLDAYLTKQGIVLFQEPRMH